MSDTRQLLKNTLKELLYDLAATSDHPAADLESLIGEAICDLYEEAKKTLQERKRHLKLVTG